MKLGAVKYLGLLVAVFLASGVFSHAQVKNTLNEEALEQARLSNLNTAQELCRIIGSQFAVPTINYEPVTSNC